MNCNLPVWLLLPSSTFGKSLLFHILGSLKVSNTFIILMRPITDIKQEKLLILEVRANT